MKSRVVSGCVVGVHHCCLMKLKEVKMLFENFVEDEKLYQKLCIDIVYVEFGVFEILKLSGVCCYYCSNGHLILETSRCGLCTIVASSCAQIDPSMWLLIFYTKIVGPKKKIDN